MTSKRTLYILVAVAVIVGGVFVVTAQDTDEPTTPPFHFGQHMMGMGHGPRWDDGTHPGLAAVAEALGLDEASLTSELQSGKTIAEIAEEQGIDLTAVHE